MYVVIVNLNFVIYIKEYIKKKKIMLPLQEKGQIAGTLLARTKSFRYFQGYGVDYFVSSA